MNRYCDFGITEVSKLAISGLNNYRHRPFFTKSSRFLKDPADFRSTLQPLIKVPVAKCQLSWHNHFPSKGHNNATIHVTYYNAMFRRFEEYHVYVNKVKSDWLIRVIESAYIEYE